MFLWCIFNQIASDLFNFFSSFQEKLSPNFDVFLCSKLVWGYSKEYRDSAKKMFEQILMECVSEVVLALPYISASGTKDTVGIPRDIKNAANCEKFSYFHFF